MSDFESLKEIFQIGPYTLRRADGRDRELLRQFIEDDPFHRGKLSPDFFLGPEPEEGEKPKGLPRGQEAWALEDQTGKVIFYFHSVVACRVSIQFGPAASLREKLTNADALLHGLAWLEAKLLSNYFGQVIFDTQNPDLMNFSERHLGFTEEAGLLSKTLAKPNVQPRALGSLPTGLPLEGGTC